MGIEHCLPLGLLEGFAASRCGGTEMLLAMVCAGRAPAIVAVPTPGQRAGRSSRPCGAPSAPDRVRLGSPFGTRQEPERRWATVRSESSVSRCATAAETGTGRRCETPVPMGPPQLEQSPYWYTVPGSVQPYAFDAAGASRFPPHSPVAFCLRAIAWAGCTAAPTGAAPRGAPGPARPLARLRVGSIHDRRARRLEQPRQRQPMRCGEFQGLLRSVGGATAEGGRKLMWCLPIGQRQPFQSRNDHRSFSHSNLQYHAISCIQGCTRPTAVGILNSTASGACRSVRHRQRDSQRTRASCAMPA